MNKSESKYFNTAIKMDKALISLLEKKSFEYITVSEICETAGVNRSTFYLHYENIGDLLEETTRYILDDFLSYFMTDKLDFSLNPKDCEIEELFFIKDKFLVPFLSYIKEHKEIFVVVLSHIKTLGMYDVYTHMFEKIFDPILDRFDYHPNDRQYIILYYLNGIKAIVMEWLRNDCVKTIDEIIEIIYICILGKYGMVLRLAPDTLAHELLQFQRDETEI